LSWCAQSDVLNHGNLSQGWAPCKGPFGSQACELLVADRPRFLESVELVDFNGNTEANHLAQLFTCLLRLLLLRSAMPLVWAIM
jgi:hypothetical protein